LRGEETNGVAKPEIIGASRSSYTRVVRMVCEEKAIDYTLTEVLVGAREVRAIHPFGKIPVLRHRDYELFESKAIATYLDRAFPDRSSYRPIRATPRSPSNGSRWSIP
jgi:glutathione S-transferase